jgi:hypothetical protein
MKYSCDHCPYETDKKANYLRHINRKFRCYDTTQKVQDDSQKVQDDSQNIQDDSQKVQDDSQNIQDDSQNIQDRESLVCEHCFKKLGSKFSLDRHKKTCKGFKSNQCPVCLKCFKSAKGKYEHIKNVSCYPPPPPENESPDNLLIVKESETMIPTITNHSQNNSQNTTNSNNNNTVNNNINIKVENNNNNNFAYNYLGNEDVSYIANKPNVLQTLKSYGKKGIYGIGDIINSIICNPEHPENSTLLKPKEYGSDVLVRDCNDANKLEFRDISDAMETIKNKALPRYLQGVCNYIKNNNITRLPDLKEKALLRKLIHIMIVLDIDVPEELENIVDIDDDKVDQDRSNEALCSSHNTKLNKSVARSAYEFTKQNYKKRNGTYVMKK